MARTIEACGGRAWVGASSMSIRGLANGFCRFEHVFQGRHWVSFSARATADLLIPTTFAI